jgi:hypothetical protein
VKVPHRVQLSRKKGWRMPANTVKVDRSTRWGNPFRPTKAMPVEKTIEKYGGWIEHDPAGQKIALEARANLKGKNLACWCPLDGPCHADFLLRIANR